MEQVENDNGTGKRGRKNAREVPSRRELNIFATGLGESVFSRSVCQKLSKTYCSHDRGTR